MSPIIQTVISIKKLYTARRTHYLKKKTTHIERSKRDFRTHLKRLTRKTGCFLKKDDMHYSIIKTYIYNTETLLKMRHTS